MHRAVDHSVRFFRSLFAEKPDDSLHKLPSCGVYALHEAYQRPVKRPSSYCSHDLKRICDDKKILDHFVSSLTSYCAHTGASNAKDNYAGESNYHRSLRILESVCPNAKEEHMELKKRQTTVAATTAPASTTKAATTPSSAAGTVAGPSSASNVASTAAPSSSSASTTGAGIGSGGASNPTTTGTVAKPSSGTSNGANNVIGGASSSSSSTSSVATIPEKVTTLVIASSTISVAPLGFAAQSAAAPNPIMALPASTYSGQQLLTSTCAIPQYTVIPLKDGSYNVAPIVGCGESNPQCCPSLTRPADAPQQPSITGSIIPLSEANSALVAALNSAPLTICPADYSSVSGNCCPYGFNLWNQEVMNQTPCFSVLAQTLNVPDAVSQEILSLSKAIAATALNPNPTVSVHIITDQIFALSLPLKNGMETAPKPKSGLSAGAKIGIGVGAGLGALIVVILGIWLCIYIRRGKKNQHQHVRTTSNSEITNWAAGASGTANAMAQRKSRASSTTAGVSSPAWSPQQRHASYVDEPNQGPANEKPFVPAQGQYFRQPPPRNPLVPTASGQTDARYSELPGGEVIPAVETDGREMTAWEIQQQQQQYQGGYDQGYAQQSGAQGYTQGYAQQPGAQVYYPPPQGAAELGSSTPRPRWME